MQNRAGGQQNRLLWLVPGVVVLAVGAGLLLANLTQLFLDSPADGPAQSVADATQPEAILITNEPQSALLLPAAAPVDQAAALPTATPAPAPIIVYITGAVQQPGVYEVAPDARVIDVVRAAQGLTDDAASEQINLAAYIRDAQHIRVPRIGDAPTSLPPPDYQDASAPVQASASLPQAGRSAMASDAARVNINTANTSELATLPGIGPVLAQRIIDHRGISGPFRSVEGLQDVSGIGPALVAQLHPLVQVE